MRGDYNNVAPRVGLAWQPPFAPRAVIRGGWGVFYERTGASYKRDLQLAAPFFVLQNVPAPPNMADPYPRLNVNPFEIPLNVRIGVDANGAPFWLREDGTRVPGLRAVHRQEQRLHRPDAAHPLSAAVDVERAVRAAARDGRWTSATSARAASGCSARSTAPSRSTRE